MAHHYAHRHEASTFEHDTLARAPKIARGTYSRRLLFDAAVVAERVLSIIETHEKARLLLRNGKPVASRMDSSTDGLLIGVYDRKATREMIRDDALVAYGFKPEPRT